MAPRAPATASARANDRGGGGGDRVRSASVCERRLLADAGIDATGVTFVEADFEKGDWLAKLVAAGFDPKRRALFPSGKA
jgi:hypothetical protein